jgi:hypothetical protein
MEEWTRGSKNPLYQNSDFLYILEKIDRRENP